jgi:CBS domain-containing protein
MKLAPTVLQAKRYGVVTCQADTNLKEAARRMVDEDISALVVVDPDGYLAGIFTRTDMLRAYQAARSLDVCCVGDHMSRDVVTVSVDNTLDQVADILTSRHIHRVVVVRLEEGRQRPVAVVSDADLVYHLVKATAGRETRAPD